MGTEVNEHTCALLGGGRILDYPAVAARLAQAHYIICADSGFDHCERLGVAPDLLVGDFDSVRAAPPEHIPRVPFPAEKDYTDTAHAIEQALERGYRNLVLAGVLGGRLDHTYANLQSLAALSRKGVAACLTDGCTDIYAVTDGELVVEPREGYYFSLFSLTERCAGVTIEGSKYPLDRYTLAFDDPRAVSNEFTGGLVFLSVERGTMALMLVPKD